MAAPAGVDIKNLQGKWLMVSFHTPLHSTILLDTQALLLPPATSTLISDIHQNKSLSDAFEPVLSLQGVGYLTRKALGLATVTQHLRQSPTTGEDGQPTTAITIDQMITGGFKGSVENRTLDWHFRGHTDWLFGTVEGRSRYSTIAKVVEESKGQGITEEDAKFLAEGWLKETEEGEVVEAFADNDGNQWIALQIWGFADIGGERKLTRRFAIRRKDKEEVVRVRMVYDYVGVLE
jgi:hypothetical protein